MTYPYPDTACGVRGQGVRRDGVKGEGDPFTYPFGVSGVRRRGRWPEGKGKGKESMVRLIAKTPNSKPRCYCWHVSCTCSIVQSVPTCIMIPEHYHCMLYIHLVVSQEHTTLPWHSQMLCVAQVQAPTKSGRQVVAPKHFNIWWIPPVISLMHEWQSPNDSYANVCPGIIIKCGFRHDETGACTLPRTLFITTTTLLTMMTSSRCCAYQHRKLSCTVSYELYHSDNCLIYKEISCISVINV